MAKLGFVKGGVWINRKGFLIKATKDMWLKAGDRILTDGGGSANVHYKNGRVEHVENSILEIESTGTVNEVARSIGDVARETGEKLRKRFEGGDKREGKSGVRGKPGE